MKIKIDTRHDLLEDLIGAWTALGALIEQRDPTYFERDRTNAAPVSVQTPPRAPEVPEHLRSAATTPAAPSNVTPIKPPPMPPPAATAAPPAPKVLHDGSPWPATVTPPPMPPPVAPPGVGSHVPLSHPSTPTQTTMIPPPPGPAAPPEYDAFGTVWDPNLHASTKTKTIDGKWKMKKGMGRQPVANGAAVPPTAPAAATVSPPAGTTPRIPPVPVPLPPNVPPTVTNHADDSDESDDVPAGSPPQPVGGMNFEDFISKLTAAMTAGTLTQPMIAEVQQRHGIESLFSLSSTPPAEIAALAAEFGIS